MELAKAKLELANIIEETINERMTAVMVKIAGKTNEIVKEQMSSFILGVPEIFKLLKMWGHLLVTRKCDLANMRSHWIPFPVLKSALSYLARLLNGE